MGEIEVELRHVPAKTCEKCGGHHFWCKVAYKEIDLKESFDGGIGIGSDVAKVEPIKCYTCENADASDLVPTHMQKAFYNPKGNQLRPKH